MKSLRKEIKRQKHAEVQVQVTFFAKSSLSYDIFNIFTLRLL